MTATMSVVGALALALVHALVLPTESYWSTHPRRAGLSMLSGIALAFASLHAFPSIVGPAGAPSDTTSDAVRYIRDYGFLVPVASLALFIGLAYAARDARHRNERPGTSRLVGVTLAHAAVNGAVGFLAATHLTSSRDRAIFFAASFASVYLLGTAAASTDELWWRRVGWWLMAVSVIAGWTVGAHATDAEPVAAAARSFVAVAVAAVVLDEEGRDEVDTPLWPLVASVIASAAVILVFLEPD